MAIGGMTQKMEIGEISAGDDFAAVNGVEIGR